MTLLKSADGNTIGFVKVMRDRTRQKLRETDWDAQALQVEVEAQSKTHERNRTWDNSLDLLLEIDVDGHIRAANPIWRALLGYELHEVVGHSIEHFVHPEDVEATVEAFKAAAKNPLAYIETRMLHKGGSYRWFVWRGAPVEGLVCATGRDITIEKAQAEQLAQTNEARLQVALEAGGMGIWEYNVLSDEVVWPPGTAKIYGMEVETQLALPLAEYLTHVHPEERDRLVETTEEVLSKDDNAQTQFRIVWPDGSVRWVDSCTHVLRDDNGVPLRMVGVCVDVTERKRAAEDLAFLASASAELATLSDPVAALERMADLAVPKFADWCTADLLQPDGTIKRVAVAHADPAKVELAHELQRRMPEEQDASHGVWNVIRTGQSELVHEIGPDFLEHITQDPKRRDAIAALGLRSYIITPLVAHGKVLGAVAFVTAESGRLYNSDDLKLAQDLANRAAIALDNATMYKAVEQSNRAKSVFLATLSHELRNPLAAMNSGLSLIQMVIDDRARVEQTLAMLKRQTGQLTRLVDDLMDASRIATGKIFLKEEQLNLGEVLAEAVEAIRPELEARRHELSVQIPSHPTAMIGDPARLVQVFSNLLTNAGRYTKPGGKIEVRLDETPTDYVVSIRDTGVGIEKQMLPRIFKLFSQVVHPSQRSEAGLGIGLSLVEGLVKLHGGRVEAFSEGLGLGSEFVVHLPRTVLSESELASVPERDDRLDDSDEVRRKILIVDDNEDAAVALRDILQMLNHEVSLAHDGYSAVDVATEVKPDVILLDIGLPGIDGYEAARRIRDEFPSHRPYLVALTGWGQNSDKQKAFEAGFDAHLVKPVSLDDLLEVLQNSRV